MRKDPEDAIEKVLTGLQTTEPPPGMQRRILETLQARTAAQSLSARTSARPITITFAAYSVALCLLVIVIAAPMIHRMGHAPAQPKTASSTIELPPPSAPTVATKEAPAPRPRSPKKPSMQTAKLIHDSDSTALGEMHAASLPAPPMPLTDQEKLLLRIAHKGDPVELAMLDSAMRAKQEAEGKTEFKKFFGPSTTGENE